VRFGVIDAVLRGDGEEDDAAVFERARTLGFEGVEIDLRRGDLGANGRLERLRAAASLPITSLILGSHNRDGGIADADAAVRGRAAAEVRTAVERAAALGADVVLVPFFLAGELVDDAAVERCAESFRALCPAAAAVGVTLAFEGGLDAARIRWIAERADSPAFGCYLDLANPIVAGLDTPTEARLLGPLVRRVHLKDTKSTRGDRRPGEGRVDFDACARALAEIGYDDWLVLETPPGPPEDVARDLDFARRHFPAR
jgi:sugar phosphate isomerase/epimerase